MTEPFAVTFEREGELHRVRYDTGDDGWLRIEERKTPCGWHVTGREQVALVEVAELREPLA